MVNNWPVSAHIPTLSTIQWPVNAWESSRDRLPLLTAEAAQALIERARELFQYAAGDRSEGKAEGIT